MYDWRRPRGMRSPSACEKMRQYFQSMHCKSWSMRTNNLLKKSSTSSVVEGPPIFMNTIAVGPLEPAAFCVTGGTAVASPLWLVMYLNRLPIADWAPREVPVNNCRGIAKGLRNAIMNMKIGVSITPIIDLIKQTKSSSIERETCPTLRLGAWKFPVSSFRANQSSCGGRKRSFRHQPGPSPDFVSPRDNASQ